MSDTSERSPGDPVGPALTQSGNASRPGPSDVPPEPPRGPEFGLLKDEYIDASNNARQFNTLRFAELTIFMTAMGALLTLVFSRVAEPTSVEAALALKVLGIAVALVFWILHHRTMTYWRHFVLRAAELETTLGFRQYTTRPKEGALPGSRAVHALFIVAIAFWLIAIGWIPPTR